MKKKDRKLINKGLSLLSLYIKGRIIGRISGGLIAGGVSILGFNNLVPYIALVMRPELSNEIRVENNITTIIGIVMIVIGAIVPVFVHIFNHYRQLYIEDLQKINSVYSIYPYDTFCDHMRRIAANASMNDYEIDKVEELYYTIRSADFYFNDQKTNLIVKRLGDELYNFNYEMSYRVIPSGVNSNTYIIPRTSPTFGHLAEDTRNDCDKLIKSYDVVKSRFEILTKEKVMRLFK